MPYRHAVIRVPGGGQLDRGQAGERTRSFVLRDWRNESTPVQPARPGTAPEHRRTRRLPRRTRLHDLRLAHQTAKAPAPTASASASCSVSPTSAPGWTPCVSPPPLPGPPPFPEQGRVRVGRPRTPIGTFGVIATCAQPNGNHVARARYRDWDGSNRLVQATGPSRAAAERKLKQKGSAIRGGYGASVMLGLEPLEQQDRFLCLVRRRGG